MTDTLPDLLLIGCGKMGGAMLSGWLERGLARAVVVEPHAASAAAFEGRATIVPDAAAIPGGFRPAAVVLAIKPQEAPAALPALARFAAGDTLFVSIMAGRSVASMRAALGDQAAVVRAMPNTPAAVRQGFTAAFAAPGVTAAQKSLADALLQAVGEVAWVEDEDQINPVTAVSGGGPAYVFLLAEVMEKAAIEQGLPPDLARRMARATVAGSGTVLMGWPVSSQMSKYSAETSAVGGMVGPRFDDEVADKVTSTRPTPDVRAPRNVAV